MGGDKNFYTVVCLALAAHGYLVIAVNHQDKSCFHTYDKDGEELYFEGFANGTAALRQAQVKTRAAEILAVIQQL